MTWQEEAQLEQAGRDAHLLAWDGAQGVGILVIRHEGRATLYLLQVAGWEEGGALHLDASPLGLPPYRVVLGAPRASSCECLGYLAQGYCRHLIALDKLYRDGRLEVL